MFWKVVCPLWALIQLFSLHSFRALGTVECYEFLVIRDTTFLCSAGQLDFRKAELTDDDKMTLLESKGGHYLKPYMARDQRSAHKQFVNPLSFHTYLQEEDEDEKNVDRDTMYAFISPLDRRAFRQKAAVLEYLRELIEEKSEDLRGESYNEATTSESEAENALIANQRLASRRTRGRRHVTSRPAPTRHHTVHTVNATVTRRVPYVLPEELGIKSAYRVGGVETVIDYCYPRGTATEDGNYLHMCTTCAATTTLPENYYPRVINEAICTAEDSHCFIVDSVPQGDCKQRTILMDFLRRKEGFCTLALKNGEMVVVDEWELATYPINVGCECTIHKNSMFAAYI